MPTQRLSELDPVASYLEKAVSAPTSQAFARAMFPPDDLFAGFGSEADIRRTVHAALEAMHTDTRTHLNAVRLQPHWLGPRAPHRGRQNTVSQTRSSR